MASESAKYLSTLHKQIDQYFSFSEVRTLCFDLGVDYENIPGDHRSAFIRNLIVSLAKQSRLQELVDQVKAERPFVDWQNVPADFELPKSIAQENIQQVVQYNVYGDYIHGDKVGGDKVSGDKISVGNISNTEGIAIGGGASVHVQHAAAGSDEERTSDSAGSEAISPAKLVDVQQALEKLNRYIEFASEAQKGAAEELAQSVKLVLAVRAANPVNALHLKLLCLGQMQLARPLAADIAGIEQVVEQFVTAVQQSPSS